MGNIYKSNYDGLQVTFNARNYHNLSFVAGYTYSHSLDDVGANWDFGAGLGIPQDSAHPQREYASSDYDMRIASPSLPLMSSREENPLPSYSKAGR